MILDTNAVAAWADGDRKVLDAFPWDGFIEIPVIVIGEYTGGLKQSRIQASLEEWLDAVLSSVSVVVLPVTFATAQWYGEIKGALARKGRPIPQNDMWIAALALEYELPVLSRDTHFDRVDGIQRIAW